MKKSILSFVIILSVAFFGACKTVKQDKTFEKSFQKELTNTDFTKNSLKVINTGKQIKYVKSPIDNDIVIYAKEVCRGNGYSFAKCVKNALDKYESVTLKKSGDIYIAEVPD